MKKLMLFSVGAVLSLGLAGCGPKQQPESPQILQQRAQSQTSTQGKRELVAPPQNSGTTR